MARIILQLPDWTRSSEYIYASHTWPFPTRLDSKNQQPHCLISTARQTGECTVRASSQLSHSSFILLFLPLALQTRVVHDWIAAIR